MSSRNVELVRKLFEVYNERSFVEHADLIDRDMRWDFAQAELPDGSSHTGPEEFREFIEGWEEGFASESMEAQEIIDAGDRVVVLVHHQGRGRVSGVEVDQHFAMVWALRDGRAVGMTIYRTREEALKAVGLSERDAHADS